MDSKERDERAKKGFGERGEKLYKPQKRRTKNRIEINREVFNKTTRKILKILVKK